MKKTETTATLKSHKAWLLQEISKATAAKLDVDDPLRIELTGRFSAFKREARRLKIRI